MEQRDLLSFGAPGRGSLSRADLVAALLAGRGAPRSDHALSSSLAPAAAATSAATPSRTDLKPAAVLVPLVGRDSGLTVLLTQRTQHLYHHAGQISFPGGGIEAGDASPEAAALRETSEEIGLAPDQVDVLGRLDDYVTGTGFHIVPIVGLLRPPLQLTPDTFEVAEIFEVPLDFVLDPVHHQRRSRTDADGRQRWFYSLGYQDRTIWGATAAMLVNLSDVLAPLWIS